MADTVHFMLSCNGNYLCHAAVVLISVMEHASPKRFYHCHYFKDDVKDWQIRQFVSISRQYKNLEITVHEPQIDINYNGHYTRSACVRLNVDKELPELEKCLYLDADMLITAYPECAGDTVMLQNRQKKPRKAHTGHKNRHRHRPHKKPNTNAQARTEGESK